MTARRLLFAKHPDLFANRGDGQFKEPCQAETHATAILAGLPVALGALHEVTFQDVSAMHCFLTTTTAAPVNRRPPKPEGSHSHEENMHALKQLPFLQDKFVAYEQHVRDHAARLALPLWGCCFEVSLKSRQTGRIHTHDYAGPSLDCAGYDVPKRVIEFKESDKVWDGMIAFHSLTSARGNVQSKKMRAVASAMYYVTSEKIGSLFVKCVRSPFEECVLVRQI